MDLTLRKKVSVMFETRMLWNVEWLERLRNLAMAEADLESDDVETDEEINFYVEAHTQALRDVLLFPVHKPQNLVVKMQLLRRHDIFHWENESFNEIWQAIIEDVSCIECRHRRRASSSK
jgi:uncharacterized protein (UPF0371 family)